MVDQHATSPANANAKMNRTSSSTLRLAACLAALGLASAGCPETLAQACPAGTTPVGNLTLSFTLLDAGDTCVILTSLDGGPTDAGTVRTPPDEPAALCTGTLDGGVPAITLAIPGQNPRTSPLVDGGFVFTSSAANVTGTLCGCGPNGLHVDEKIQGSLQSKSGGPVAFDADGGLTPVGSLAASFDDAIFAAPPLPPDGGPGSGCACNLPCGAHYTIAGHL